jgi:hypothetical protein
MNKAAASFPEHWDLRAERRQFKANCRAGVCIIIAEIETALSGKFFPDEFQITLIMMAQRQFTPFQIHPQFVFPIIVALQNPSTTTYRKPGSDDSGQILYRSINLFWIRIFRSNINSH